MIYLIVFLVYCVIRQHREIKNKNKIIDSLNIYKQIFQDKYVDDDLDD